MNRPAGALVYRFEARWAVFDSWNIQDLGEALETEAA
jgi:hypothetical protein